MTPNGYISVMAIVENSDEDELLHPDMVKLDVFNLNVVNISYYQPIDNEWVLVAMNNGDYFEVYSSEEDFGNAIKESQMNINILMAGN